MRPENFKGFVYNLNSGYAVRLTSFNRAINSMIYEMTVGKESLGILYAEYDTPYHRDRDTIVPNTTRKAVATITVDWEQVEEEERKALALRSNRQ